MSSAQNHPANGSLWSQTRQTSPWETSGPTRASSPISRMSPLYSGGSAVKNLPAMQETPVRSLGLVHGGVSAPSCCAFIHKVAFEEVSGHRVLMNSRLGNRCRSAFGTTNVANLEFPHETGLILRCATKVMKPFQTKQRIRPSCGDQEGRSGSDEVLLGTSVCPSSETGMSGNFWGRIKRSKYHFTLQNGTWDFSWGAPAGKGLILE